MPCVFSLLHSGLQLFSPRALESNNFSFVRRARPPFCSLIPLFSCCACPRPPHPPCLEPRLHFAFSSFNWLLFSFLVEALYPIVEWFPTLSPLSVFRDQGLTPFFTMLFLCLKSSPHQSMRVLFSLYCEGRHPDACFSIPLF